MAARSRLLLLPLVAVLLPSVAVAVIGYQWLRLEQDADARRSIEAADAESARLRRDLVVHLRELAVAIDRDWRDPDVRSPFADPVRLPEAALAAFRLGAGGTILDPDYDGAYRRGIQAAQDASGDPAAPTARAAHLLRQGRVSLARRDYQHAASLAGQILDCCAAARDEYGYSFAIYAARQLAAAWRCEGVLAERLANLARRLERLLDEGAIGHPADVADLRALIKDDVESPATTAVVRKADASAIRIAEATTLAARLSAWAAVLPPPDPSGTFSLATLRVDDRLHLLGVLPGSGPSALVVLYRLDYVGERIAATAAAVARFDAALLIGTEPAGDRLSVPLMPETPGLRLAIRARETDSSVPARRRSLLAGGLAAVLAILGVVAVFALRDISREVRLASLRADFVASVTHELKTPLTSIRLLAETLVLGRTRDPAVAGQLLQGIIDESDRLGHLVGNVLAVARIDQGAAPGPRLETTAGRGGRRSRGAHRPPAASARLHAGARRRRSTASCTGRRRRPRAGAGEPARRTP